MLEYLWVPVNSIRGNNVGTKYITMLAKNVPSVNIYDYNRSNELIEFYR
jgi:hypothetical protein